MIFITFGAFTKGSVFMSLGGDGSFVLSMALMFLCKPSFIGVKVLDTWLARKSGMDSDL